MSGAADIPGKKAKFTLDAPTVLGTKIDAILLDNVAYYKVAGMLGGMLGGSGTQFVKVDVPQESGKPVTDVAEIAKAIDEFKTLLDKLPSPPTKGADEKCGDQDCYHVTLKMTADDINALDPGVAAADGDFSLDLLDPQERSPAGQDRAGGHVGGDGHRRHDVRVQVRRLGLRRGPARGPDRPVATSFQEHLSPGPPKPPARGFFVPGRRPREGRRPTMTE